MGVGNVNRFLPKFGGVIRGLVPTTDHVVLAASGLHITS